MGYVMLAPASTVAAYLYLHTAEQMPEDATDEWFLQPEPNPIHLPVIEEFMRQTQVLVDAIEHSTEHTNDHYQTLFYDAAKATFDGDKKMIRTYFAWLYWILFQRDSGPRWGEFVMALGREEFVAYVKERFRNLI